LAGDLNQIGGRRVQPTSSSSSQPEETAMPLFIAQIFVSGQATSRGSRK
jgi:hypothetical protein